MDSYRTVHKNCGITSIFIRPEVYGHVADYQAEENPKVVEKFGFKHCEEDMLIKTLEFKQNSLKYYVYQIKESGLSKSHKACLMSINEPSTRSRNEEDYKKTAETMDKAVYDKDKATL